MIKKLHYIWLGGDIPKEYLRWIINAEKLMPDYEIILWRDNHNIKLINQNLYDAEKQLAAKSDLLRYEILYRYGGFYADCDIEFRKSLDHLAVDHHKLYVVEECLGVINNALMYSDPHNQTLYKLIVGCQKRKYIALLPARYGPRHITLFYEHNKENMEIVSNKTICSNLSHISSLLPGCVGYHHYRGTWK